MLSLIKHITSLNSTSLIKKAIKLLLSLSIILIASCNIPLAKSKIQTSNLPQFNADSAYQTIQTLLSFGPRVPGSDAHKKAEEFIVRKLLNYNFCVQIQKDSAYRFDSTLIPIVNIWASFNPYAEKRIMLFTHYDTRFIADLCPDSTKRNTPIPGANDSGSGVALLLEIARIVSNNPPQNLGIDIMFFDAEDQGEPGRYAKRMEQWALGSRSWIKNFYNPNYKPLYAIGVDMVAYKNAKFAIEDFSLYNYGYLIKRIWHIAKILGYDTLFVDVRTPPLFNDHIVISKYTKIRAIMIIENIPGQTYGPYWHTHQDTITIISKKTIKAVGQTLVTVLYNENL